MSEKRQYDWSQIVKKVDIVDAPPYMPYNSFKSQTSKGVVKEYKAPGTVEVEYEKAPLKVSWIPENEPVTKENLLKYLSVTEEDRKRIWTIDQREPDWHRQRAGRLTGSRVGSAAGHNKYSTPEKLINEWLYVEVEDNHLMKWGRDNEDGARESYCNIRRNQFKTEKLHFFPFLFKLFPKKFTRYTVEFDAPPSYLDPDYRQTDNIVPVDPNEVSDDPYKIEVTVRGLIVHPTINYFGYSPDGEIVETDDQGLLEIKCPQRMYPEIPWYYYDQIQFGMFNLGLKWCDFFCWTRDRTTLKRYAFNEDYWNHDLFPKLQTFYEEKFLPEAIIAIEKEREWHLNPNKKFIKKLHL